MLRGAAIAGLVAIVCHCPHAFAVDAGYQHMVLVKTIAHQDGDARLDYAYIDGVSRRLYVARGFGVTAVDLDTEQMTRQLWTGWNTRCDLRIQRRRLVGPGERFDCRGCSHRCAGFQDRAPLPAYGRLPSHGQRNRAR
jgi:hypothetical protein